MESADLRRAGDGHPPLERVAHGLKVDTQNSFQGTREEKGSLPQVEPGLRGWMLVFLQYKMLISVD